MNGSKWLADHETHMKLEYQTYDYVPQEIMSRDDFTDGELDKIIAAVTVKGSFSNRLLGRMLVFLIKFKETGNYEYYYIAKDYLGALGGTGWGI